MCMRCFATRDTWLDVDEKFNCPEDIRRARATAVGPSVPIRGLLGWVPEMHVPDLLHTVVFARSCNKYLVLQINLKSRKKVNKKQKKMTEKCIPTL